VALSDYEKQRIDGIANSVSEHGARLDALDEQMEHKVSKDAFWPVRTFVYATIGTLLTAALGFATKFLHLPGLIP
jgi:hypothetical protein